MKLNPERFPLYGTLSLALVVACSSGPQVYDPSMPTKLAPDEPQDCASTDENVGVQRFDRWLLGEYCRKGEEFDPDAALEQLRQDAAKQAQASDAQVLYRLDANQAKQLGAPPPRGSQAVDTYVTLPVALQRTRTVVKSHDYAGSGIEIAIGPFRFGDKNGHPQITKRAIGQLDLAQTPGFAGFSPSARQLLADASQDPDFYEWGQPEAHAQTGVKSDSIPVTGNWQGLWQEWMHRQIKRSRDAAKVGDVKQALYFLGYALHGIEDLASHQGRTNAEHSYEAFLLGQNPDEQESTIRRAEEYATLFLRSIAPTYGANWATLAGYSGPELISREEKRRWLEHGWDLSIKTLIQYRSLAESFARHRGKDGTIVRYCSVDGDKTSLPPCTSFIVPSTRM